MRPPSRFIAHSLEVIRVNTVALRVKAHCDAVAQSLEVLAQSQDPTAQQVAALLQGSLEQIPDVADEGAKG